VNLRGEYYISHSTLMVKEKLSGLTRLTNTEIASSPQPPAAGWDFSQ